MVDQANNRLVNPSDFAIDRTSTTGSIERAASKSRQSERRDPMTHAQEIIVKIENDLVSGIEEAETRCLFTTFLGEDEDPQINTIPWKHTSCTNSL